MNNEEVVFLVYDRDQGDLEECLGIEDAREKAYEMAMGQVPMCDDYETLKTLDQIGIFKMYGSVLVGGQADKLKDTPITVNTFDLFDSLKSDKIQSLESELKKRDELLREACNKLDDTHDSLFKKEVEIFLNKPEIKAILEDK